MPELLSHSSFLVHTPFNVVDESESTVVHSEFGNFTTENNENFPEIIVLKVKGESLS